MKNYVKTISLCLGLASLTFAQTTTAPIYSASILAGIPSGNSVGNGGPSVYGTVSSPQGIALDSAGNIYIADNQNSYIRKIDAQTGVISNFVTTNVSGPNQITFDNKGQLWVANPGDHRTLRVSADGKTSTRMTHNGVTNTFGGDGNYAVDAYFNSAQGIAVDNNGNVYIADSSNNRVRMLKNDNNCINTPVTINGVSKTHSCTVVTIAGNGNTIAPQVGTSCGTNNTCKAVGTNTVGDGGPALLARVNNPTSLAVTPDGSKLYIAQTGDHRIRVVDMTTGIIDSLIGNCVSALVVVPCPSGSFGSATPARSNGVTTLGDGKPSDQGTTNTPRGLFLDNTNNILYFADGGLVSTSSSTDNAGRIRAINLNTGIVNTVVGGGNQANDQGTALNSGLLTTASLVAPWSVAVQNGLIYWVEQGSNKVRVADPPAQKITTLVNGVRSTGSGGPATQAYLGFDTSLASTRSPRVAVDAAGNVYAVEAGTHKVRKITSDGIINDWAGTGVSGFAGDGGPATAARLASPQSVAFDQSGNAYIADTGNNRIRKVDTNGVITTVVGRAAPGTCNANDIRQGICTPPDKSDYVGDGGAPEKARLNAPQGVAVDPLGNLVIADTGHNSIRYVDFANNTIDTIAGGVTAGIPNGPTDGRSGAGTSGFLDSTNALYALLNAPRGVAVDGKGNIYVAEWGGQFTRELVPNGRGGYSAFSFYGSASSSSGNPAIPTGTGNATVPAALRLATNDPVSVAVDPGNNIYFTLSQGWRVNVITADHSKIYKVIGDGSNDTGLNYTSSNAANLQAPAVSGVAVDSKGVVYTADRTGVIRKLVCTANCLSLKP
jgi:sugar lactone lactonase YvrE